MQQTPKNERTDGRTDGRTKRRASDPHIFTRAPHTQACMGGRRAMRSCKYHIHRGVSPGCLINGITQVSPLCVCGKYRASEEFRGHQSTGSAGLKPDHKCGRAGVSGLIHGVSGQKARAGRGRRVWGKRRIGGQSPG